jgi:hypothetical protein
MMEDIGAEVDPIGPGDSSRLRIYADLPKHVDILKRGEHTAAPYDSVAEVNLSLRAVTEVQLQNVVANMLD